MIFNSSADSRNRLPRGTIKFGDQALLWALASRVKPSTGKIEYRISVLAKRMGMPSRPSRSSQRLRAADFVRLGETRADMNSG